MPRVALALLAVLWSKCIARVSNPATTVRVCDPLLTVAHVPSLTSTAHSLAALSHAAQPHIHTSPFMSCCAHPSSRTRGALVCASASYVGRRVADRVARTQGRSLRSIARSHDTPRSTLRSHDAQPIARRSTNRTTLNQSATNQVSQAMRAMPHPIGAAQRSHARGL